MPEQSTVLWWVLRPSLTWLIEVVSELSTVNDPMADEASSDPTALQRSEAVVRAKFWGLSLVVFLIGALISATIFAGVRSRQRGLRRIDFERAAHRIALIARSSFDIPLEVVRGVSALFEASEQVSRSEFQEFVSGALVRYPWIYALEWIPRVAGHERPAMEAAAVADGFVGFHFKQDAPIGPPVRAEERSEYYPLYYMEPPNAVALGIEETALAVRRVAIERARDFDTTAITERLRLVQDDESVVSVIAFHPVYRVGHALDLETRRQRLQGFSAAVFRVRAVLQDTLTGGALERYSLVLTDLDAKPPMLLFESHPGAAQRLAAGNVASSEQVASIAGRRWGMRVGDRTNWVNANDSGWIELATGLLVSLLLAACTFATQRVRQLRSQVRAARKLGQYTLVEKLGEGGMGTVYRAQHAMLRRPTALKLMHASSSQPSALARFESEVQLTATLTHPNTVVVYDYGQSPDHVFYYAMEYIHGATLQDIVDACGPQPPERVVPILLQICSALAEAHGIGLVHRDIKPANIMLCTRGSIPDFVKVLDFGLVKDLSADNNPDLSKSALLIGTPLYVAPEVALRRPVDARADLYALGAVAYFLITGTPVFIGNTVFEVCAKHLTAQPESMSCRLGRDISDALEAIVARCLAKDPNDRFESAQAMGLALQWLEMKRWDVEQAREWWNVHGHIVEEHGRSMRSIQGESSARTLDVDRSDWQGWSSRAQNKGKLRLPVPPKQTRLSK